MIDGIPNHRGGGAGLFFLQKDMIGLSILQFSIVPCYSPSLIPPLVGGTSVHCSIESEQLRDTARRRSRCAGIGMF